MPRTKTTEATEAAVANAGNEDRPPEEQIEAAVALLQRWAPKRLHHSERKPGPKRAYECKFCHVKVESQDEEVKCPRLCHEEGRSTMQPVAA